MLVISASQSRHLKGMMFTYTNIKKRPLINVCQRTHAQLPEYDNPFYNCQFCRKKLYRMCSTLCV